MKQLFFLAALLSLSCLSCKAKKEAVKNTPSEPAASNLAPSSDTSNTYALIVSFKSQGAGIPTEQRADLLKYVENHPKKPAYAMVLWGREGETDYCFKLSEMTGEKEKNQFLTDIKKMMKGNYLVEIAENSESLHQGR
ncbi:MAG: hypothetical protein K0R26_2143 [Bacteroidota bacterium]|jgi:hypothetical protein|nr:hypothetical protein [Bacteroidota bacterium]